MKKRKHKRHLIYISEITSKMNVLDLILHKIGGYTHFTHVSNILLNFGHLYFVPGSNLEFER